MLKACFNHKNTEWLLFYVFIQLLIQINHSKNSQYHKHSLDGWWMKGKTKLLTPKTKRSGGWFSYALQAVFLVAWLGPLRWKGYSKSIWTSSGCPFDRLAACPGCVPPFTLCSTLSWIDSQKWGWMDGRWLAQDKHLPPMIKYFYSYVSGVLQDGITPIHRVRWRVK